MVRRLAGLLALLCAACSPGLAPAEQPAPKPPAPPLFDFHLAEGSVLRAVLCEERVEFTTPYGKLSVPAQDVYRVEAGTRLSDDTARRVEKLVADLAHADYATRQRASEELVGLREKAIGAVMRAAKSADMEVARRAEEVVEKLRNTVPGERLALREHDALHTPHGRFTGRFDKATWLVRSAILGEIRLDLANVREAKQADVEEEPRNVLPDPGNMTPYREHVGKVFAFRVTGQVNTGGVWGTDVYSFDTSIGASAVHAGVLQPGQSGVVKVRVLGPQPGFVGSTRNGVTSMPYGPYPSAYEFIPPR